MRVLCVLWLCISCVCVYVREGQGQCSLDSLLLVGYRLSNEGSEGSIFKVQISIHTD